MKKLVLLLILMTSLSAKSQYQSIFGDSSTSWQTIMGSPFFYNFLDSTYVVQDSVIGGQEYKMLSNGIFLAEDTTIGRVWELNTSSIVGDGWTLMDLSLQLGDTFYIPRYAGPAVIVDSIFFEGGLKHIRFDKSIANRSPTERVMMIEGVGLNVSGMYSLTATQTMHYLTCQHKDGQINFANNHPEWQGDCAPPGNYLGAEDLDANLGLHVFPNPTRGFLNIESEKEVELIEIYSVTGKKILEQTYSPLSISMFPNGVYYVKIHSAGQILSQKVVKN